MSDNEDNKREESENETSSTTIDLWLWDIVDEDDEDDDFDFDFDRPEEETFLESQTELPEKSEEPSTPSNDYDILLQRYYHIKEENPRFRKYEKHVVEVIESCRIRFSSVGFDFIIHDLQELSKKLFFEIKLPHRRRRHRKVKVIKVKLKFLINNSLSGYEIQCPRCKSYKVTAYGSKGDNKKLMCKDCNYSFYLNAILKELFFFPKITIAIMLIEKGCSQNFVAKLFRVASSTVGKWRKDYPIINDDIT